MHHQIRKYPVQNPILKKYIKFFWELRTENIQLNHRLIPQRNINLRLNLSETPQYIQSSGKDNLLDKVYFSGLYDHHSHARLVSEGNINMLGVCFYSEAFYPFFKIPVSEYKNQILGADDIGFGEAKNITAQLLEAGDITSRLSVLENALISMLHDEKQIPEDFTRIFLQLNQCSNSQFHAYCKQNNFSMRKLERMYNKYVGLPANSYNTLNRFHASLSQLLSGRYCKLSDLAYDNGYFDQMHFTRDFKRFAGDTPKSFVRQNNSILQIGKFT